MLFTAVYCFALSKHRSELAALPWARATSLSAAAAGDQVDNQDDQSDHQQNVNQAACNVKAESQQPQDHENHEDCPEHTFLLRLTGATGIKAHPMAPASIYD